MDPLFHLQVIYITFSQAAQIDEHVHGRQREEEEDLEAPCPI
jgi:hypothetical protein